MPMLTSRNIDGGYLTGFTTSSYSSRCSSMPLPLARVSMTTQSIRAEVNHQWNETWGQNLLPWSSSALNPTQDKIAEFYWDVYQLWRLPRRSGFEEGTEEGI